MAASRLFGITWETNRVRSVSPFEIFHPLVPLIYFTAMLIMVMACFHPVYLAIAFVAGFAYNLATRGVCDTLKSLAWQLPMVAIIAIVNPLFSASGATEIFRIGPRAIYAEALIYGACMGVLLVDAMMWISIATNSISSDGFMSIFGNIAPTITLMISMTARLVPQFARQGKSIADVQAACTSSKVDGSDKFRSNLRIVNVLLGWTMEDSLDSADAMRAAGWNSSARRTTYSRYLFKNRDMVAVVAIALLIGLSAAFAILACSSFAIYPTMTPISFNIGFVIYGMLAFLPLILKGIEDFGYSH